MEFKTTLISYTGNSDWVSDTLLRIKETLMDDKLPPANESWDENRYFYERLQVEQQFSE